MKILFAAILIGSLFISTLIFAADYAQTKNKVDDRDNDLKSIPSQADQNGNLGSSDQMRNRPETDPQSDIGSGSGSKSSLDGQSQFEKDTGISDKNIPGREK